MANEELKFELDTINEKGELVVVNYEKTLAMAQAILDANPVFEIITEDDKKKAKNLRATFNSCIKMIDRTRIDSIDDLVRSFTEQCNSIKKLFDDRQKELGERVKAYEDSQKEVLFEKTKIITATLKFTDGNLITKIRDFCNANNIGLTIK